MPASGISLYIHWPFCASKCPYCDFNSHVADSVDHHRWRRGLLAELGYFANETKGRQLTSIFFGGGTPSLMEPETTAALIEAAKTHWQPVDGLEITLEANPSTAETKRFQAFRDAGVNRLSLGVQSFRDSYLGFLGRGHSAAEAMDAIQAYKWPGNVRQLRSLCERWIIPRPSQRLEREQLPFDMRNGSPGAESDQSTYTVDETRQLAEVTERILHQVERSYLHKLLKRNAGHMAATAKAAGITRRTLYTKMKQLTTL